MTTYRPMSHSLLYSQMVWQCRAEMEAVATLGSMQPQVLSADALPDGDLQVGVPTPHKARSPIIACNRNLTHCLLTVVSC